MSVGELIKKLQLLEQEATVYISCEGGCVQDNDIHVIAENERVTLSIE